MVNWISLLLTAVPLGGWLIYSSRRKFAKTEAGYAAKHGLGFNAGDPARLLELPFDLFDREERGQAANTTWTTHDGIHMASAQYMRDGRTTSIVVADVPYNIPPLRVRRRDSQETFVRHRNRVEFADSEFNEKFIVECDYPTLVKELLSEATLATLLESKFEFGFEFNNGRFMIFAAEIEEPRALFQAVSRTLDSISLPWWANAEYYTLSGKTAPLGLPSGAPA
jgi:hypothetical protein